MVEHTGHAHHDYAEPPVHHHDHGSSKQSGTTDACFKCCGLCIASSHPTELTQFGQIALIALPISYALSGEHYVGRTVLIDPGIPKRMA